MKYISLININNKIVGQVEVKESLEETIIELDALLLKFDAIGENRNVYEIALTEDV